MIFKTLDVEACFGLKDKKYCYTTYWFFGINNY